MVVYSWYYNAKEQLMYIVVLITAKDVAEARKIARALIAKKCAACVNIIPRIESVYRWKGKVESGKESLLVAKTAQSKFSLLVKTVQSAHSYELPEIIAVPLAAGEKNYLEWINGSLN
jgi:periplasmic divalent cation tolerance protein